MNKRYGKGKNEVKSETESKEEGRWEGNVHKGGHIWQVINECKEISNVVSNFFLVGIILLQL